MQGLLLGKGGSASGLMAQGRSWVTTAAFQLSWTHQEWKGKSMLKTEGTPDHLFQGMHGKQKRWSNLKLSRLLLSFYVTENGSANNSCKLTKAVQRLRVGCIYLTPSQQKPTFPPLKKSRAIFKLKHKAELHQGDWFKGWFRWMHWM